MEEEGAANCDVTGSYKVHFGVAAFCEPKGTYVLEELRVPCCCYNQLVACGFDGTVQGMLAAGADGNAEKRRSVGELLEICKEDGGQENILIVIDEFLSGHMMPFATCRMWFPDCGGGV